TEKAALAGQFGGLYCVQADHDNDGHMDIFIARGGWLRVPMRPSLLRNNGDGTFTDVTRQMGIDGPAKGFSCWDCDNDGWPDLFATSYGRTLADVVKGLLGQPHGRHANRLFRNEAGKGFKDVTKEAGLDFCFAAMGS